MITSSQIEMITSSQMLILLNPTQEKEDFF